MVVYGIWTFCAAIIAFAISAAVGKFLIPYLHKLNFGQTILDIGPSWHKEKQGTPVMGGIMFIIAITFVTLVSTLVYVFFGESVPMISPAAEAVGDADIFVIIGTSLVVYPAAGLVHYVKPGTPIYLIDPENVSTAGIPNLTHIRKGASEGMRQLVELLP